MGIREHPTVQGETTRPMVVTIRPFLTVLTKNAGTSISLDEFYDYSHLTFSMNYSLNLFLHLMDGNYLRKDER
jgi:hypothetical protein